MLEVLKLSSAKDLLQFLSCVVQWYRLSTHTDVWQAYCENEGVDLNDAWQSCQRSLQVEQ